MKEFLRCLLLPVDTKIWVLPYSAVAEVVEMDLDEDMEKITWRGIELPVIKIKQNSDLPRTKNIAILNRCAENAKDFCGLRLSGVPTMQRFKRSDIEWVGNGNAPQILMEVKIRDQSALIPNLKLL